MNRSQSNSDRNAILSLLTGWLLSSGAVTAVAVLSLWITRLWLPLMAFTLGLGLYILVRRNREASFTMCYVVPYLCIYVMGISGVSMLAVDLLNTSWLFESPVIDSRSSVLPYMGAMIVYPVAAVIYSWGYWRGYKLGYCVDCRLRLGAPAERGTLAMIFSQEGVYQRRLMAMICLTLAAVCWLYYFIAYINISLTQADIYVFFILPALVFAVAGVYMAIRYMSIYYYYDRDISGGLPSDNGTTTVRYIIISGNEFFLHVPDPSVDTMVICDKIDTPAQLHFPFRRDIHLSNARQWFLNMSGTPDPHAIEVRFMYSGHNVTSESNTFHYLVFASSHEAIDRGSMQGEWFSIYDLQSLLRQGMCNQILGAEVVRLHTIAMAWKTYDREGHRLYKIKNYTPTFRVCDIHKWDVDYNDSHWLWVALNNEDKPFYHWRRFWRRYISGISQ